METCLSAIRAVGDVPSYFTYHILCRDLNEFIIAFLKGRHIHTLTCYAETFHVLLLLQLVVFRTAGLYKLAY